MKRFFYLALLILSLFTIIMLFVQNGEQVGVKFLIWRWDTSLALFSLTSFSLGAIITFILNLPLWLKKRSEVKQIKQEIDAMFKASTKQAYSKDILSQPTPDKPTETI